MTYKPLYLSPLLKVSSNQVMIEKRKFDCIEQSLRSHLEVVGTNFLLGYHSAIKGIPPQESNQINQLEPRYIGFAYEGAAMGFMISDLLSPRKRFQSFIDQSPEHIYMLYVGAGWAFGKIPFVSIENRINEFDPLLKWLMIDGYGFHQAYFKTKLYIHHKKFPRELKKIASQKAFYQGIGRAHWFVFGGQPEKIANSILRYSSDFHSDLWAGVGLAAMYAGGVSESVLHKIQQTAIDHQAYLAQGSAFACKARLLADNVTSDTELASIIFTQRTVEEAAKLTDECLKKVPNIKSDDAYQQWRSIVAQTLQII